MKKLDRKRKTILIFLARKRGYRNALKRWWRRIRKIQKVDSKKELRNSSLCHYYDRSVCSMGRKQPKNISRPEVPQNFSFIENCEKTCIFLNDLVSSVQNNKTKKIYLDQSKCTNIDLCAETVTAVLLKDIGDNYKIKLQGKYPDDYELKRVVCASGITKYLKVVNYNPEDMCLFPIVKGRKVKSQANESPSKDIEADKLINYINECLNKCGWQIVKDSKAKFAKAFVEILDNAEEHSQKINWWITAYSKELASKKIECHLVLFNFGISVYQSMQKLPLENALRTRIEGLIKKHQGKHFFSKKWDDETLWTLYSLQEGSSRFYAQGEENKDRGQGLSDLIQFFQEIGESDDGETPVMVMVSGNVYIKFDNDYKIVKRNKNGNERRQIAFNHSNSLEEPPDKNKVMKLSSTFPGTLYSFKFIIDDKHLQKLQKEK